MQGKTSIETEEMPMKSRLLNSRRFSVAPMMECEERRRKIRNFWTLGEMHRLDVVRLVVLGPAAFFCRNNVCLKSRTSKRPTTLQWPNLEVCGDMPPIRAD
jgi:hypothetical protein